MSPVPKLLLLSLAVAAPAWSAAPDPLVRAITLHNQHADEPLPLLQPAQLDSLRAGEVLRLYLKPSASYDGGTLGLVLSTIARERLWLAARDTHFSTTADLTEQQLGEDDRGELWYGYLDIPWPFGARHWLVHVRNNSSLARASAGRSWERSWRLQASGEASALERLRRGDIVGLDASAAEDAIYTPSNHGAWLAIEVPGLGTLLGYQVTTSVGGLIPDELVAQYALFRMEQILRDVEKRAATVHRHYHQGHAAILDGSGRPIPRYGRPSPTPDGPDLARLESAARP